MKHRANILALIEKMNFAEEDHFDGKLRRTAPRCNLSVQVVGFSVEKAAASTVRRAELTSLDFAAPGTKLGTKKHSGYVFSFDSKLTPAFPRKDLRKVLRAVYETVAGHSWTWSCTSGSRHNVFMWFRGMLGDLVRPAVNCVPS